MSERIDFTKVREDVLTAPRRPPWEFDPAVALALVEAVEADHAVEAIIAEAPVAPSDYDDHFDRLNIAFTRRRLALSRFAFGDTA